MSAPLVVNVKDGGCWTRRMVTRDGLALYAPERVKTCPDFVMATLPELAERGIVGSAYALPVPVGPERQSRGVLDRARDAVDARMSKDALRHVLENVISYAAEMERQRDAFRDQRNAVFATNERLHAEVQQSDQARLLAENETRTVRREADALRARLPEYERPADEDPIAYTLTEQAAPDFFQPGHAYTHQPGPDTIGGPRIRFYCETVTTGQPIARGWGGRRYGDQWTSVQQARGLEDWQSGAWTDTTGGDR